MHSGDQAAPFLLHCLRSCHPLSRSDYLEICSSPPRAQCPYSLAVSSATSPAVAGRAGPEGSSDSLWDARAGPDRAGPPSHPETHPLSSLPLTGALGKSGQAQICLSVSGSKMDTNLPPISSAHRVGYLAGPQFFLSCWFGLGNLERGKNSILVAVTESVRNLGS